MGFRYHEIRSQITEDKCNIHLRLALYVPQLQWSEIYDGSEKCTQLAHRLYFFGYASKYWSSRAGIGGKVHWLRGLRDGFEINCALLLLHPKRISKPLTVIQSIRPDGDRRWIREMGLINYLY